MTNNPISKISIGLSLAIVFLLPFSANAEDDVINGGVVYEGTCIACHGESGKGEIPGVADFTSKKGPLTKTDDELFDHILNGFQSDNSDMEMPALGGNEELSEQDITDVIVYLRATFQTN